MRKKNLYTKYVRCTRDCAMQVHETVQDRFTRKGSHDRASVHRLKKKKKRKKDGSKRGNQLSRLSSKCIYRFMWPALIFGRQFPRVYIVYILGNSVPSILATFDVRSMK